MKNVALVVLVLLLVAGGLFMYGSSRAQDGKEYAERMDTALDALIDRFTEATKTEAGSAEQAFIKVAQDAKATADGIKGAPAPVGAASLKRDASALVTTIGEMSLQMAQISAYSSTLDRIGTVFSDSLPSDIKDMKDLTRQAETSKKAALQMAEELGRSNPPEAFQEYNAKLIVVLNDLAEALDGMEGAAAKGDFAAVTRQVGDLSKVEADFAAVKAPGSGALASGMFDSDSGKSFTTLSKKVEEELVALKSKIVTF